MGMNNRLTTTVLSLLALATTLPSLEAFADHPRRSSSSYGRLNPNTSTGTPSTQTTLGRRASRQVAPQTPSIPRSLLPPGGSATNVRPGFYQQLNAPPSQHGGHGNAVSYVVYVPTTPNYTAPHQVAPSSIHTAQNVPTTPPLNPPTQTAPQPVYVVNPPTDTRAPQPVYIVNPNAAGSPAAGVPAVQPLAPQASRPSSPTPPAKPLEPVDVEYRIAPADAKVYLDDELIGTGSDLADSAETLRLKPGVHVLEVTHPDHRPQRVVFGVSSSEPLTVAVDLTTERIGRRSRVR